MKIFSLLGKIILITALLAAVGFAVVYNKEIMAYSNAYLVNREGHKAMAAEAWVQATEIYESAVKAHPETLEFQVTLADLYRRQGVDAKAEALYQKILKVAPQDLSARNGYAMLLMNDPARINDAVKQCREALRHDRGNPALLTTLGDIYKHAAENPAETREPIRKWLYEWASYYYRVALRNDPMRFEPRFSLGVVYQQLERPEEAAVHYCDALLVSPKSYEARYNLGLTLVNMNAYDEGYRQLAGAVQTLMDENHVEAAQKLAEQVQTVKNSVFQNGQNGGLAASALPKGLDTRCLTLEVKEKPKNP